MLGRRNFLRSLIGMASVQSEPDHWQKPIPDTFIWANLKTGQIGFPTGFANIDVLSGSLFHLVTAACLVQINCADDKHICNGNFEQNENTFTCPASHGDVDIASALSLNCQVFFAKAASNLMAKDLLNTADRLGLISQVGDFQAGVSPVSANLDRASASLIATGMSPIFRPSPLQYLRLTSYIATSGILPRLHSAENPAEGVESVPPDITEPTWQKLRAGMLASAQEGACQSLDSVQTLRLSAIGSAVKHSKAYVSWLTGFFPNEEPRYAFLALNESETANGNAFHLAQVYLSANWL